MRFSRSFLSGLAGIVALIVLVALAMLIVDEGCSRNVSEDEMAGMAIQQHIQFGGNK
jgi:hypothetical protein